jgi:hypothetical protein
MITKELLERLQSYLTKEEAESAIPQFKKQYDNHFGCVNQDSKASDMLLAGFDWELSVEGGDYWDKLYEKVLKRENN